MSNFESHSEYRAATSEIFMRCPDCMKLYVVETKSFQSQNPYFDCQVCQTRFKFSGDFLPGENIATERVSPETTSQIKECQHCGHINSVDSKECRSCQIVFKKVESLQIKNPKPSTLDIQWSLLIDRFEDLGQHNRFLKLCAEMGELDWAHKKYRELNSISGGDPTCQGMMQKILVLQNDLRVSGIQKIKILNWSLYAYWTFLSIGLFCFVGGIFSHSLKNLIGLGIAIWALSYGITVSLRGSTVSFRDFLNPKN